MLNHPFNKPIFHEQWTFNSSLFLFDKSWKSIVMLYYSEKDAKWRFNRNHVTKVSANICKRLQKTYSAGKNFI